MTITREQGYAIEGGPEPKPIDDTAPERLRERREALGWHRARAADGMPLLWHDIERLETGRTDEDAADRARYAAALSAEEARRAVLAKAGYADSPVWDDGPLPATKPERPAPRFKVGDWVRVVTGPNSAGRTAPILVTCITSAGCIQADGATWAADHLEPATPPAPEVVDVPQPLVKRFGGVEASWGPGRLDVITLEEINGDDEPFDVPVALLRAMLEAIDAQQGGA